MANSPEQVVEALRGDGSVPLYLKPVEVTSPVKVLAAAGDPARLGLVMKNPDNKWVTVSFADGFIVEFDGAWLRAQAEMRR